MVRESLQGNFKAAKAINDPLIQAYELMFAENNPAGVKAFMTELGLIENHLRLAHDAAQRRAVQPCKELSEEINRIMNKAGLMPSASVLLLFYELLFHFWK